MHWSYVFLELTHQCVPLYFFLSAMMKPVMWFWSQTEINHSCAWPCLVGKHVNWSWSWGSLMIDYVNICCVVIAYNQKAVHQCFVKSCWDWFMNTRLKSCASLFLVCERTLKDYFLYIHCIDGLEKESQLHSEYIEAETKWPIYFADGIFKCIFLNENCFILIQISLKFVPEGPINDNPA